MNLYEWFFGKQKSALYLATHDKNTGLYNSNGFDMLYRDADRKHSAMIIIELMDCQNKPYRMIEKDMRRMADEIRKSFRSVDDICRIRTDDIAIIMARMDTSKREVAEKKMEHLFEAVKPDSIVAGIAFGDRENPKADLFHDAVSALNRARINGRDSYVVFGD